MDSVDEVRAHLNTLHEAVWELTAIALALRDPATTDPDHRRRAEQVLLATGMMQMTPSGPVPATGLAGAAGGELSRVSGQAAAALLQSAAVLSGACAWAAEDDEALIAQGRGSAQAAPAFKAFVVPVLDGLGDLLAGSAPVMLDVGVGVAAMAVAYCEAFPGLKVVGIDVFPRALDLARRIVDDAGMADRIELRRQDVATLEDRDVFCLAWLPAPFVPEAAIAAGLPRMVRALVPGGWCVVGHGKFDDGVSAAVTRFQTVAFGGTALDDDEAEHLLRDAGLTQVASLVTPPGAPGLTVGRKPGAG